MSEELEEGALVLQRWRLLRRKEGGEAEGERSEFWRATDVADSSTVVAVKAAQPGHEDAIKWEGEVLRRLQAMPFVPRYFYSGEANGREVLVYQLLRGETLAALRKRNLSQMPKESAESRDADADGSGDGSGSGAGGGSGGSGGSGGLPVHACVDLAQALVRCVRSVHAAGFALREVSLDSIAFAAPGNKEPCLASVAAARPLGAWEEPTSPLPPPAATDAGGAAALLYGPPPAAAAGAADGNDSAAAPPAGSSGMVTVCRRDDLWRVLYCFFDLLLGSLPWAAAVTAGDAAEVAALKDKYRQQPLSPSMQVNISASVIMNRLGSLAASEIPDYEAVINGFEQMRAAGAAMDGAVAKSFSWGPPPPPRLSSPSPPPPPPPPPMVVMSPPPPPPPPPPPLAPPAAPSAVPSVAPKAGSSDGAVTEGGGSEGAGGGVTANASESGTGTAAGAAAPPTPAGLGWGEKLAAVAAQKDERERCRAWCKLAAGAVRRSPRSVPHLEAALALAVASHTFLCTPGLSDKQMLRVQKAVYEVEDAIRESKTRPLPVLAFSEVDDAAEDAAAARRAARATAAAARGGGGGGGGGVGGGGGSVVKVGASSSAAEVEDGSDRGVGGSNSGAEPGEKRKRDE